MWAPLAALLRFLGRLFRGRAEQQRIDLGVVLDRNDEVADTAMKMLRECREDATRARKEARLAGIQVTRLLERITAMEKERDERTAERDIERATRIREEVECERRIQALTDRLKAAGL